MTFLPPVFIIDFLNGNYIPLELTKRNPYKDFKLPQMNTSKKVWVDPLENWPNTPEEIVIGHMCKKTFFMFHHCKNIKKMMKLWQKSCHKEQHAGFLPFTIELQGKPIVMCGILDPMEVTTTWKKKCVTHFAKP